MLHFFKIGFIFVSLILGISIFQWTQPQGLYDDDVDTLDIMNDHLSSVEDNGKSEGDNNNHLEKSLAVLKDLLDDGQLELF
jgi:hypothetical protein